MLRWWLPDHFQIVHAGEGEETGREKMRSGRIAGKPHTRQKEFCTAVRVSRSGNLVVLNWRGAPNVALQKATSLTAQQQL